MMQRPTVVVFDVNETLSDMSALAPCFAEIGAPEGLRALWFASLLRDGFALTAAGASAPFATVARGVLASLLAADPPSVPLDEAVEHVMAGLAGLPVHDDVPDGVRAIAASGVRLVTLTNGSAEMSEALLTRAGVRENFERLMSVESAGAWKPAPGSYAYAARTCGCEPGEMMLVAVHPWDIDGASRAGMRAAFVDRKGAPYPSHLQPPETTATDLVELAGQLGT